jgi:hypothetical protein
MAFSADVGCRVEVQLELLVLMAVLAIMPLGWDFTARQFASSGDAEQHQSEQTEQNTGPLALSEHHGVILSTIPEVLRVIPL